MSNPTKIWSGVGHAVRQPSSLRLGFLACEPTLSRVAVRWAHGALADALFARRHVRGDPGGAGTDLCAIASRRAWARVAMRAGTRFPTLVARARPDTARPGCRRFRALPANATCAYCVAACALFSLRVSVLARGSTWQRPGDSVLLAELHVRMLRKLLSEAELLRKSRQVCEDRRPNPRALPLLCVYLRRSVPFF
eukprot:6211241-Pleurochrysis_carterae.AAC.4